MITYKVHFFAYFKILITIFLWAAFYLYVINTDLYQQLRVESFGGWDVFLIFLIVLVLPQRIYHFFYLRSIKITVGDKGVSYKHGIIPWKKFNYYWHNDQIYGSEVSGSGFIKWLFKYGTVHIIGKEGTTRKTPIKGIGNAEKCCIHINSIVPHAD